jgi:hypothetical protein
MNGEVLLAMMTPGARRNHRSTALSFNPGGPLVGLACGVRVALGFDANARGKWSLA